MGTLVTSLLTAAGKLDLPGQGLHLYLQQLQVGTLFACVTAVQGEQRKPSRTVMVSLPLLKTVSATVDTSSLCVHEP